MKWNAPSNTGGVDLTGFNVYYAIGSGDYQLIVGAPPATNPTILTYTFSTGIEAGQPYKFKVSALNIIGESLTSEPIFVYAASMPEAPTNPPTVLEFD